MQRDADEEFSCQTKLRKDYAKKECQSEQSDVMFGTDLAPTHKGICLRLSE